MKQLLNTLYVTTQGAYLAKDGETVLVRVEEESRLRVPIHTLGSIVCFGRVSCSPALMGMCAEKGVALSFLTENGRFLARVEGPVSGNVLLRREQYRRAENDEQTAAIARSVVIAKVANCRTVLLRAAREKPDGAGCADLEAAALRLLRLGETLQQPLALDTVRGHEGDAARVYFEVFDHLIVEAKDAFFFRGRSRRPPLDNMNALLSFLYTLVTHDVAAALEGVGLDPAVGYLHVDRPGRPSLALDLVEELRPVLADRLGLSLVNRRQVRAEGFRRTESGAVEMDDDTRKEVLVGYQKRKQEEVLHPFLKERVAFGIVPHVQAMLLARYLRGDLDGYPSFLWR
jgi:CRISPR-associated protein Cas1